MLWKTNPELFFSLIIGVLVFIIEFLLVLWWTERKKAKKVQRMGYSKQPTRSELRPPMSKAS